MSRQNFSDITMVLDRSGSMESIAADIIGGVNNFVESQKAQPGDAVFTLAQFDNEYELVCVAKALGEVPPLTPFTFVPRGSTCLLGAVGRAIDETGARLAAMPEHERPSSVIFVIVTDGEENTSHERAWSKRYFGDNIVANMIKHQQEAYSWDFVFLAANQDAMASGAKLNIPSSNAMTFMPCHAGVDMAYEKTSGLVGRMRGGIKSGFLAAERAEQDEANK